MRAGLPLSPRLGSAAPPKRAGGATIAFLERNRPSGRDPAMALATSRGRDVRGFAANDAREALVGLDRPHHRFGHPGMD
jgi:hypothetical protein